MNKLPKIREIKHIAIIGLGLIGGSLALALKNKGYKVFGIDLNVKNLKLAISRKAIYKGYTKLTPRAFKNVELIFIATPLSVIPKIISQVSKLIKNEVILSDVGSTKFEICNLAKKTLPENIIFIGTHPMAGSEKKDFQAAHSSLFEGSAWTFTPLDKSKKTKTALEILIRLIKKLGAKPVITTPANHDKAVAFISHLPLLVSLGLCKLVMKLRDKELKKLALMIVSSGFRDTTRIAGGNPRLNSDLIVSNLFKIASLLGGYQKELREILRLSKSNPTRLFKDLVIISKWQNKL